ncbi:MAG: deoxyribonuclease IV [Gemmatimonadetes bacterium]|nr:deoxyribonuclease IV [Gemmatimonadota bacterium]
MKGKRAKASAARRPAVKKTVAKKAAAKKAAAKKAVVKKAATKKPSSKKPLPKKPLPKKPLPKKPAAKKPVAKTVAPVAPKKKSSRDIRPKASDVRLSTVPKPVVPSPDPLGPLGAHVSTQGGVALAPQRGDDIGASGIQVFTKVPNQWKEKEVTADEVAAYRAAMSASGQRWATSHDSYLINLASPDPTLRARSLESFIMELRRCNALGLDALVSHPGNFLDERASGIARNADAITQALEAAPGPTRLCMELTAGQGTVIGSTFEEMADLLARIPSPLQHRLGVCLDTCHVYAAGYDLRNDYDGVWARFADVIGFARLGVLHLNDSMGALGSRKDRHALLGEGEIGDGAFRRIMTDERLRLVPKMLETPKGDDMVSNDRRMLTKLRGFAAAG